MPSPTPSDEAHPTSPRPLSELRSAIDSVDERLVALLAERARLVVEVGHAKRHEGVAIYAPSRERAVFERAVGRNPGPLGARTGGSLRGLGGRFGRSGRHR